MDSIKEIYKKRDELAEKINKLLNEYKEVSQFIFNINIDSTSEISNVKVTTGYKVDIRLRP